MKNHHSKTYRNNRAVSIWLQNSTCYNCSTIILDPETHHLDHNSKNHDIRNLAVLCTSCHALFHRIPRQPLIPIKKIVVLLLQKVEFYTKQSHGK